MSSAQRAAVVDALPAEIPWWECGAPEGDEHFDAKAEGLDTLRRYYRHLNRRIYLAAELATYYPDEPRFSPDLLAVADVDPHTRGKWVVSAEGKGLDLVIEVLAMGSRAKDLRTNVARYAALGIPEYFVFDVLKKQLHGWRLTPGLRVYAPIAWDHGALASAVLGLELFVSHGRPRFRNGPAEVLAADDLIARLDEIVAERTLAIEEAEARADEAQARADEAQARADEAQARADEAQARERAQARRVAELEAELEAIKRSR